jgi:hypothetical protein
MCYLFEDYFTAVTVSLHPVSTFPFCNNFLHQGSLLPLYCLSSPILAIHVYAPPMVIDLTILAAALATTHGVQH